MGNYVETIESSYSNRQDLSPSKVTECPWLYCNNSEIVRKYSQQKFGKLMFFINKNVVDDV